MWAGFVDLIRVTIFGAAHLCAGSLGGGILAVSIAMRLALMPLTLRLARQAYLQQLRLTALKPEIDALKRRYAGDPARLMREMQQLHTANGVRLVSPGGLIGMLVQLPLLSGLFAAVRAGLGERVGFLWVADLARPDALLVITAALLAAGSMVIAPRPEGAGNSSVLVFLTLGVGGTLFFLWSASSAVALSVGAGSLVSALQSWLLARDRRCAPSPA